MRIAFRKSFFTISQFDKPVLSSRSCCVPAAVLVVVPLVDA